MNRHALPRTRLPKESSPRRTLCNLRYVRQNRRQSFVSLRKSTISQNDMFKIPEAAVGRLNNPPEKESLLTHYNQTFSGAFNHMWTQVKRLTKPDVAMKSQTGASSSLCSSLLPAYSPCRTSSCKEEKGLCRIPHPTFVMVL